MEMKQTASTEVKLSANATTSVYVCRWNDGAVQIELGDYDANGVWQKFEIELTNKIARDLVEEIVSDLHDYDEKTAKEAAEHAAEEAAEEAERIAAEQGVEDMS
jgi:hypothetical protein